MNLEKCFGWSCTLLVGWELPAARPSALVYGGGHRGAATPEGKPTFKLQNKVEKEKEEALSVAGRPPGHGNTTAKSSSGT